MSGVSAGRDIIIAGHGARIIQGAYVDRRTITILAPPNADPEWLKQIAREFEVDARETAPDRQSFARFEAQLDMAARRLEALEARALQVHFPSDLAGLRQLHKEVEDRIAVIINKEGGDFSWLAHAPFSSAYIKGYRLQNQRFIVDPLHAPSIRTRFSDGSFAVLYAALDAVGALFEVVHFHQRAGALLRDFVFVEIETDCQRLLDLRDQATRAFIDAHAPGLSREIVAEGDWLQSTRFGSTLANAGFDGCIFPSPVSVDRHNVVFFPGNLPVGAVRTKRLGPVVF